MSLHVKHDGHEIEVRFNHASIGPAKLNHYGVNVPDPNGPQLMRRCSMVEVLVNGNALSTGFSVCHPGDRFNKSFGRKRAMAKALIILEKSARKAV